MQVKPLRDTVLGLMYCDNFKLLACLYPWLRNVCKSKTYSKFSTGNPVIGVELQYVRSVSGPGEAPHRSTQVFDDNSQRVINFFSHLS